jgi:hypothetical protein
MSAVLDMNSFNINNLPDATANQQPVTLAQAASIAGVTNPLSQETVAAVLWPETAAETSAGVTPTNFQYEPGNVLRYGTNTSPGTTDMLTAIQNAIDVMAGAGGGVVFFPYEFGGYLVSSTIQIKEGVHLTGDAPFEGWIAWATALASGNFITLASSADVPLLQVASGVDHWGIHNLKFNGNGLTQTLYSAVGLHAVHESIGFVIDGCLFMNFKGYAVLKLGRGVCEIYNNTFEGGCCFQRMSDMKLIGNNIFTDSTAKTPEFPPLWIGSLAVKNLVTNNFIWRGCNPANLLSKDISSISGDTITFGSAHGFFEKMPVMITTTGGLPPPLDTTSDAQNLGYTYYVNVVNTTQIKLAKTWANYNAGTYITFTGAGTGTHTLSHGDACCFLLNEEVSLYNKICNNRIEDGYHHATVINGARNTIFTGNFSGKSSVSDAAGAAGLLLKNFAIRNTLSDNFCGQDLSAGALSNEDYGIDVDSTSYDNVFDNNYTANNDVADIRDGYIAVYDKRNFWGVRERFGNQSTNVTIPFAEKVDSEIVAATNAITVAENNKTFYLNAGGEFTSTLPAPAIGLKYTFIIGAAPSGASYTIVTTSSANIMSGTVSDIVGETVYATAQDVITFVDGVSVIGDRVDIESDGTNWYYRAVSGANGGITTGVT